MLMGITVSAFVPKRGALQQQYMQDSQTRGPVPALNFSTSPFAQEFGDAVAQCVQYAAEQRPSAEHLLKHRFFKLAARHPQHLVRQLWRQVPEHPDRSGSSAHPASDSEAGERHASWCTCQLRTLVKSQQAEEAPSLRSGYTRALQPSSWAVPPHHATAGTSGDPTR